MVDYSKEIAMFIALAIEKNLEEIYHGSTESTFVDHVSVYDPLLEDAANIQNVSLNSAWNFADQFFFSFAHNDPKMAGIEWEKAFSQLREIVTKLKSGDPITEPTILTFQHPIPKNKTQHKLLGPASPKGNMLRAILKKSVVGLISGVFGGLVISLFIFVVRIGFARHGYDLYPYIYYGAPPIEIIIGSLIYLHYKYVAIGFAFGAISVSLLIAIMLTVIDGLDTLD